MSLLERAKDCLALYVKKPASIVGEWVWGVLDLEEVKVCLKLLKAAPRPNILTYINLIPLISIIQTMEFRIEVL